MAEHGLATQLSKEQEAALIRLNPDSVSAADYAPFKGCSMGLFSVAPGWGRLELTADGRKVRAALSLLPGDIHDRTQRNP